MLPIVIIFIYIEYSLRSLDSGYEQKRNQLIAQRNNIEILILGDSHTADGINPLYLRGAFNLAYGSQTILYDKQLILKYRPVLKKLRYVIINFDYMSLYWGFSKERDFFYYHYYGINMKNKSYTKENFSYFFYVYSPKTAIKLLIDKPKFSFVNGWAGYQYTDYGALTEENGKKTVSNYNYDINTSLKINEHKYICSELENLIRFLKKERIIPIIVTTPGYKYYTSNLDSKILKYNQRYIENLTLKYNLMYFNALKDSTFKENQFYNNDHLNKYGAKKFTMMLDSLISARY